MKWKQDQLYSICDSRGSNFDIIYLVKYWRQGHKSTHFLEENDTRNTPNRLLQSRSSFVKITHTHTSYFDLLPEKHEQSIIDLLVLILMYFWWHYFGNKMKFLMNCILIQKESGLHSFWCILDTFSPLEWYIFLMKMKTGSNIGLFVPIWIPVFLMTPLWQYFFSWNKHWFVLIL